MIRFLSEDDAIKKYNGLETPVLYMVFNRLDIVKKAFGQIKKVKPKKLYIAQDGPREHIEGEKEKVLAVRDYILSSIDWDCEVKTLFREKNLGIDKATLSAIDWFFEHEEQGIILEEDIYMSLSGFWFLEKMLNKFEDDKDIWFVLAYNIIDIPYDYVKTDYFWSWGYASWADKWKKLMFSKKVDFGQIKDSSFLYKYFENPRLSKLYEIYLVLHDKNKDFYDVRISRELICKNGYSIIPKIPLSSHIGFENSTYFSEATKDIFIDNVEKYHVAVEDLRDIDLSYLDEYNETYFINTFEKVLNIFGKYNIFYALVSNDIEDKIKKILLNYKKISIYGVGVMGQAFYLVYNDLLNNKVCCFLDDNPKDKELMGKPILKPENIPEDVELVIISPQSKKAYEAMKEKVSGRNVVWLRDIILS
jgi:predicted CoA-binding protein